MASGAVQTVVVCVPSAFSQSPCPSGQAIATVQAYLLDSSQKAAIEAATAPFDYAFASGGWSLGFTTVVGLYLVARSAGTILDFIKR